MERGAKLAKAHGRRFEHGVALVEPIAAGYDGIEHVNMLLLNFFAT